MVGLPSGRSFAMPMMNGFVPSAIRPYIYIFFAFCFQLSGCMFGGAMQHAMGATCLMREDITMVVLCAVVGINMPFPFLFRFKFRFTNQQLLMTAALVIAACNLLSMYTENVVLLCIMSYFTGFFKMIGTFESFSNIQLWITPTRDFTIWFPAIYCIVLGNMSLVPFITIWATYSAQDWHVMNWIMIALMCFIALAVFTLTHPWRPMSKISLISLDWSGCLLWSGLMVELIFLFNYGEYYNWWDGYDWRIGVMLFVITLYMTLRRMIKIRHPYIDPAAWRYKKLIPLMGLFCMVELAGAIPKVLQTRITGGVLHYGTLETSAFYIIEWAGAIAGCVFVWLWIKKMRRKFTHLLIVGTASIFIYEVMMYFLVQPGISREMFYVPIFFRAFGIATFFTDLTIYLQEVMSFQHFFMGVTMAGLIRNGVMDTVCSGIYSFLLRYHIVENMARGVGHDATQATLVSIKQLYGVTCFIGFAALMAFLLWDIQPVRSTLKKMPNWPAVGKEIKKNLNRARKLAMLRSGDD